MGRSRDRGVLFPSGEEQWTRMRFHVDMCIACAVKMNVMCNMHVRDARTNGRERSEDHLYVPAVATLQVQDLILALSKHHKGGSFPAA